MPIYHTLGKIPKKRHTVFRKPDGGLHHEHLMGTLGFDGPSSLLYHLRPPTRLLSEKLLKEVHWEREGDPEVRMRHFRLFELPAHGSPTLDRIPILFNNHVAMSFSHPAKEDEHFFRNGQGDELYFIAKGEGVVESLFGSLSYRTGDYLVIPRGILYRFRFTSEEQRFVITEGSGPFRTPAKYRGEHGQLLEHSPICERDIRRPEELITLDEPGEHMVVVKRQNTLTETVMSHNPLDVVGWDGYYYPWAVNIDDFEPITGSLHQPPPVHLILVNDRFVVCAFVPRKFDYHPEAIPAPYNHSNVMSDEVLFYANDRFMSRKGIDFGSMTLHPAGLTHGPHPGMYEGSVGKKETEEKALMLDTFDPVWVAQTIRQVEDEEYPRSWLPKG